MKMRPPTKKASGDEGDGRRLKGTNKMRYHEALGIFIVEWMSP